MIGVYDRQGNCYGTVETRKEAKEIMREAGLYQGVPSWNLFTRKIALDEEEVFWSTFEKQVEAYRKQFGTF